jgi:hypothetical protein
VRLELQSLRREFHLDDDIGSIISEWPKFQERLTQVRYKAKLDSQDPPRDEPSAPPQKVLAQRRGGRNSRAREQRNPAPMAASEPIGTADGPQQG